MPEGTPREDPTEGALIVASGPLPPRASLDVDVLAASCGERGAFRTVEFLTANIRNRHTRRAYHAAVRRFLAWSTARSLRLEAVRSVDVAAYVEELGTCSPPSPSSSTWRPSSTGSTGS